MKKHSLAALVLAALLLFSSCRRTPSPADTSAPGSESNPPVTQPETDPPVLHPTGTALDTYSSLFMTDAIPAQGNDSFFVYADEGSFVALAFTWSEGTEIHPVIYRISPDGKSIT